METRDIIVNGAKVGELSLPAGTSESVWADKLASYAAAPTVSFDAVTPRQMRLALLSMGIHTSDIDTALASLPEPTKTEAQISWEYSLSFERTNPLVAMVATMLGWNSAQVDALWALAGSL
jgi:hypothetical protein